MEVIMQKITYTNYLNGLSATFSNRDPQRFLADFDGNSVSATAIAYKPAEFDGQRFISANLNARTITFSAQWSVIGYSGRFSDSAAFAVWEDLQKVFVPGQYGKLVWTNGRGKTRFIECRTEATPKLTQKFPHVLGADFKLIADLPYWQDEKENVFVFPRPHSLHNTVVNGCGIPVPFIFMCERGFPYFGRSNSASGVDNETLTLIPDGSEQNEPVVIDTGARTVTIGGKPAEKYLTSAAEFFSLNTGENDFFCTDANGDLGECKLIWHDHYLGVNA